nr:hypothetical protein [Tanacetum cinerariifolium]
MSFAKTKLIVAHKVANAIETISIYETKTRMARESMSQTKQRKEKVAENASNKRKWKGDHNGSSSQQQNKGHKMFRAHTNQSTLTCFKCGNQGYYKSKCLELENRNERNQAGGTKACGMVYALGGGETN